MNTLENIQTLTLILDELQKAAIEQNADARYDLNIEQETGTELRLIASPEGQLYAAFFYHNNMIHHVMSQDSKNLVIPMLKFISYFDDLKHETSVQATAPHNVIERLVQTVMKDPEELKKEQELEHVQKILELAGPYEHYEKALICFGENKANHMLKKFKQVMENTKIPKDFSLIKEENEFYITIHGQTLTTELLDAYITTTKQNSLELYHIFKNAVPYLKMEWQKILDDEIEKDLIASLITERIRQGLTIEELAEKQNIAVDYLKQIETRKQSPNLRTINRILKGLGKELKLI